MTMPSNKWEEAVTDTNIDTRINETLFKLRTTREVEHNDNQWTTEFVYTLEEAKAQIKQLLVDVLQEIASVGYDGINQTYDYDAIAEALLERLAALQGEG